VLAAANYTWYVARAGGILAFTLLSASVVLGLLLSGRAKLARWPRFALEDVHRFVGLLAGSFLAIHVGALLVDRYLPFSVTSVLVPFAAPYRPLAVAAGVIAAELLVALAVTNHYRAQLSYRFWRRAHYLNFAVWMLALAHGIAAGTDTTAAWALGMYVASAGAVAGLTVRRVLVAMPSAGSWALRLWPGTAALVTAELVVALALGPLGHHA
jgi:methionine sulfoxide reductase heme-binding subunit